MSVPQTMKAAKAACLIALPMLAISLQAQQIGEAWNPAANPGSDGLWSTAANWSLDVLPVSGYKAFFNVSPVVPCVVNSTVGGCQISIGDGGPGELIVTNGGNLSAGYAGTNIDDFGWTGIGEVGNGTMIVEPGASVTFLYHVFIGYSSNSIGTFIINGGTASIQNPNGTFAIGTGGGTGTAQLNGGTLTINNNLQLPNAGPQIDIAGGTLTINLNGNTSDNWDPLIIAGKIVAYGGAGALNVDTTSVAGETIITASTNTGTNVTVTDDSSDSVYLTNSILANDRIVLSWNSRGTLERATNIGGPWMAVTNSWPYTNQITGSATFFRLNQTVDASTLHKKVLCGYQGWFRCAGDVGGTGIEWDHWSANWSAAPTTNTLTFDMWPDVSDYSNSYPAPGFTATNGAQSYLYSADDQQVVNEHFDWMRNYGIDGVVVQRFVTALPPENVQAWKTNVLLYARAAANRDGRVFFLEYDMSGGNTSTLFNQMTNDWTYLYNTLKIPQDPRYLHQNGNPLVMIFGLYSPAYPNTAVTNSLALNQQIIAWFETNSMQSATVIGSGEWEWASDTTAGWSNLFHSCDGFCPWNTGNYSIVVNGNTTNFYATTSYWPQDLTSATNAGMFFWPQIYPGYSAHHLTGGPFNQIPRIGGVFLWKQFNAVASLGLDWCYLGMFDEVDEGTAIYKVSNNPPTQAQFLDYDADGNTLSNDWYMRIAAEGSKIIAGERPNTNNIPISP